MNPIDWRRELEKILDAVEMAARHFEAEAEMNAALHLAATVRPSPLCVAIQTARDDLQRLVMEAGGGQTPVDKALREQSPPLI